MASRTWTFTGHILGVGTAGGVRLVVGTWDDSPLGAFADVMVEKVDGHRMLLAPSEQVAEFVSSTYSFDETRIEPVFVLRTPRRLEVRTRSLRLDAELGRRTVLGRLLRLLPRPLAAHPVVSTVTDPVARVVLPGVRTRGTAGNGRREYYGATDVRAVTDATATLDGVRLGALAPVDPPTRFGFSSTPRTPSLTRVVTTVVEPG
ncbi:hypothetical protein GCM10009584_30540 [Ornithinimicrobium humiphilum]|uniref:Uncharacterized protein n=1 Tax=Ornithinimicrobium humiphilum TaxID=125288 RepID=A0A543K6T8_9MICO|nr:hypothetical protein [Ornithinimicrobium humiphilum]TQM90780.1 hypothetical protein FB476_3164 [Ornithinimicrobium humiphilum]